MVGIRIGEEAALKAVTGNTVASSSLAPTARFCSTYGATSAQVLMSEQHLLFRHFLYVSRRAHRDVTVLPVLHIPKGGAWR